MTKGILGKKLGMTQVFTPEGLVVPVTVVQAGPCTVLQKKDVENDGYEAIQIGFADKKEQNANKPELGHAKKAGTTPKRYVKELRGVAISEYEVGQEIKADVFAEGEFVDVTGTSKGKGFQGVIKRHNQSRGPMAHGSRYHRGPGSMGSIQANRVPKGKNLPGHMGSETVTIQGLEVVKIDVERNVLLIKGSIPGPKNSYVTVKSTVKA
ncbi:50S ribosomal protein L3 [Paenibacillus mucilaginosus]|uniref:Large ribosomal subunit protein uL3 n=2 Tax=Paenibacillus mucilaginosus TaxID=61624 RepID=H6NS23_9BACL|nr:50S ribosomal protein L3 [Paenibacillus mucilaginosus]AFC33652.1 50S ribosomal protein L3 [Paenibacillus mucilaginosus 3016]AFH65983.1 50S ribosomal protein L3 [Paenibacillus mucilaginosus K02]MCG7217693.1 50S ribosomal protein L3 [Paenibacillus mucilaginosus]WDM27366.1 50S ribosomal protein L3 [Paenibacillus mucilaginosus]WFA22053.1 50S ribosomal protein L3 [Paenibacillus mucilaginosus]